MNRLARFTTSTTYRVHTMFGQILFRQLHVWVMPVSLLGILPFSVFSTCPTQSHQESKYLSVSTQTQVATLKTSENGSLSVSLLPRDPCLDLPTSQGWQWKVVGEHSGVSAKRQRSLLNPNKCSEGRSAGLAQCTSEPQRGRPPNAALDFKVRSAQRHVTTETEFSDTCDIQVSALNKSIPLWSD